MVRPFSQSIKKIQLSIQEQELKLQVMFESSTIFKERLLKIETNVKDYSGLPSFYLTTPQCFCSTAASFLSCIMFQNSECAFHTARWGFFSFQRSSMGIRVPLLKCWFCISRQILLALREWITSILLPTFCSIVSVLKGWISL